MARQFNMTSQSQDAMRELYMKEMKVRLKWHQENIKRAKEMAQPRAKAKERLKLPSIHLAPPAEGPETKVEKEVCEGPPTAVEKVVEDLGAEMKPPTPRTKELLYHGTTKQDQGRYLYLKARSKIIPEEKYIFPITTNFEYGWQIGKLSSRMGKTHIFRRCRIVNDTFFRKNGAMTVLDPRDMAF
ncbi:protein SPMIP1 [Lissotriton helveticus]